VSTYPDLEDFIEAKAKENQIDVNLPFPFLLEGTVTKLDWHVINWPRGDMDHSHEKHIQSGLNGRIENQNVSVLGFFSDRHQGIFTHHTVNSHMHFLTEDRTLAGHVDDLELGKSMVLKLPLK
ncbi:MAG: acetolactate decarboxylase, partial [Bacteroidia bacterium]|nr:acetolactate decarboxylase [Bacteroidia bacterium]